MLKARVSISLGVFRVESFGLGPFTVTTSSSGDRGFEFGAIFRKERIRNSSNPSWSLRLKVQGTPDPHSIVVTDARLHASA